MFELEPLMSVYLMLCVRLVCWMCGELNNWWCHFQLANLISDWHRDSLHVKMKAKGIKFCPQPLPGPLLALPCNWMVLSCVMMSMWSVAMAGPIVKPTPVTWVAAIGSVRDLKHSFPPPPPPEPPDPFASSLASSSVGESMSATVPVNPLDPGSAPGSESSTDGEGEKERRQKKNRDSSGCVNVNQLKPQLTLDVDDWMDLTTCRPNGELSICRPCDGGMSIHRPNDGGMSINTEPGSESDETTATTATCETPTALEWDDFDCHVDGWRCFLSSFMPSFGPLGLLSADPDDNEAFVDTAASITVTPHRSDFVEYEKVEGKVLKGLSTGAAIQGRGIIHWRLEVGSKVVDLKLRALHVPSTDHRLLCPQQMNKEHKPRPKHCSIEDDAVVIEFAEGTVICPCNQSNIPVLNLTGAKEAAEDLKALNACVTLENNQNLSMAKKELLKWHCRLGHIALPRIQKLMRAGALGHSPKIKGAAHLYLAKHPVKCGSCEFGRVKRRATRTGKHSKETPEPMKVLSKDVLIPGQRVSMDHFIVSTPGRLFNSRGSEAHDRMFKGGVIFVDHATGFVFVAPVVNFTAGEAIRAKREFEAEMASKGVTVISYHTDNGVFTAAAFQDELSKLEQGLSLSGVGAHHQNAVAERAIGTVTGIARTIMLHAKIRWPKQVTTKLWPMAMKQAQFLVNHVPDLNNVCPMDLMLKTMVPRHQLRHVHVWGAPCFVLDPKLQDGHKIPKFDPRSRQGLNLGWSPKHASSVPLVLNLTTGNISPQFHVVFDDWFTTVSSISDREDQEPIDGETWTNLLADQRIQVAFDEDDPVAVDDEWLTEIERIERHQKAVARVQGNLPSAAPLSDDVGTEQTPHLPPPPSASLPDPSMPEMPKQREQVPVPVVQNPTASALQREQAPVNPQVTQKVQVPSQSSR